MGASARKKIAGLFRWTTKQARGQAGPSWEAPLDTRRIIERIREILAPVVEPAGLELVDATLRSEGGRWILRITIDREGGVRVEDCAFVSRELGVHLDVEDLVPVRYHLEVSSPGLDRPLRDERDFRRYAGRLALIRTHRSVGGRKKLRGTLEGMHGGAVRVRLEEGEEVDVPLEDIAAARLDFDFAGAPKGGKRPR